MGNSISSIYDLYLESGKVSTDSRNLPPSCLFFALKGGNFNGNKFASKAIKEGASYAIIDEEQYQEDERFILVDDVLETLQQLAAYHRMQLKVPVIGITGTNGKTTSKELIREVLSKKFNVLATKGNLNNHIGVPLTLLSANKQHDLLIIEMGANHIGEIKELCEISQPDYGIITNVGKAHIEGFGSFEGVVKTKKELYDYVSKVKGHVIVNKDNSTLMEMLSGYDKKTTYGLMNADVTGELVRQDPYLELNWQSGVTNQPLKSQLFGYYNFENILLAVCVGNLFEVEAAFIGDAIQDYAPTNNRSQVIQKEKNTIYLDAYNANPTSVNIALESFNTMEATPKMIILGDMLELGEESEKEHALVVQQLLDSNFEKVALVGEQFSKVQLPKEIIHFPTTDQLCVWLEDESLEKYTILIKGSRGIQLERSVEFIP